MFTGTTNLNKPAVVDHFAFQPLCVMNYEIQTDQLPSQRQ